MTTNTAENLTLSTYILYCFIETSITVLTYRHVDGLALKEETRFQPGILITHLSNYELLFNVKSGDFKNYYKKVF